MPPFFLPVFGLRPTPLKMRFEKSDIVVESRICRRLNHFGSWLQEGFRAFDRKMHGFLTNEAVIVGVESRSSSPVRIPRDADTYEHLQLHRN